MHPILYDFGFLSLKSYGLMLAIAFFVGIYLAKREAIKEGIEGKHIDSLSFGLIISAIVGARLLHVIAEQPAYYLKHPIDIFKVNTGGLAFYGGFILAIAYSVYYCVKHKLGFLKIADIISPSIATGIMFARIGCFLAGCCYGKQCDLPWAVTFTNPLGAGETGVPLHPTQLYESFLGLAIFIILISIRKFKRFEGELFLILLIIYSVMRSFIEFFRADNRGGFASLSTSQLISIPIFIFAVYLFIKKWKESKEPVQ